MYKFDRWHIIGLVEKKYVSGIIAFCNSLSCRDSLVEIGCGLGDITRNVKYKNRTGYDRDKNALKAAKFLSLGNKISFFEFYFPQDTLYGQFDVIIMVNWIHEIEPKILGTAIENYFKNNLKEKGVMILDTVMAKDQGYKYHHDINILTQNITCEITIIGTDVNQRTVWALKK